MSTQTHSGVSTGYDVRTETGRRTFTETKLGYKTSEFLMAVVAIAGILIAAYADGDDNFTRNDGFRYAAWVAVAYIVSRGLAKLGTSEPYREDR
jgi:hypothetical protein